MSIQLSVLASRLEGFGHFQQTGWLELSVPSLTLLQILLLAPNFHLSEEVSLWNQQHHGYKRNQIAQLVLKSCICVPNLIAFQPFLQQLWAAVRSSTFSWMVEITGNRQRLFRRPSSLSIIQYLLRQTTLLSYRVILSFGGTGTGFVNNNSSNYS